MEFFELLKKRRACHHFQAGRPIPDSDLKEMIQWAGLAPSGYNAQPWEFILIREPENLKKVSEIAFNQPHLKNVSALVVVLADMEIGRNVDRLLQDWLNFGYISEEEIPVYRNSIAKNRSPEKKKQMGLRNAMLSAMTFILSAENMGYATCPVMGFSQLELEAHLKIPEDRLIALMIAVGYPDSDKEERPRLPRKSLEELCHWEEF